MQHKQLRLAKDFKVAIGNRRSQCAEMTRPPGESEGGPGNKHRGSDQWLFVVSGKGVAIVEKQRVQLQAGTVLLIELGETHQIRNTGTTPLKTVNFYVPPGYSQDGDELPRGKAELRARSLPAALSWQSGRPG
jgi:mannose-6-phosphate isomerase-like protein (cupin superfamily)